MSHSEIPCGILDLKPKWPGKPSWSLQHRTRLGQGGRNVEELDDLLCSVPATLSGYPRVITGLTVVAAKVEVIIGISVTASTVWFLSLSCGCLLCRCLS